LVKENIKNDLFISKSSKVAAITGASSGIGEAYAKALAMQGYDLVLISKDIAGLKKVADGIKKVNNVVIKLIMADLSSEKQIEVTAKKLEKLNVSMLVNNAGFGIANSFCETDPELLKEMINVHVQTTAIFTRAVLPKMISEQKGAIINVSSLAVFFHNRKNNTIYESTKNFVLSFSKALAKELEGTKVKIQVVCPGYTRTNFMTSDTVKGRDYSMIPSWMWMTSDGVVEESLRKLNKKKTILVPGRVNKIIVFVLKCKLLSWMPLIIVRKK
jgi:hypothetical protein